MSTEPSVLLILTGQHRCNPLGADPNCPLDEDGFPLIHTPNLNQFVQRGAPLFLGVHANTFLDSRAPLLLDRADSSDERVPELDDRRVVVFPHTPR